MRGVVRSAPRALVLAAALHWSCTSSTPSQGSGPGLVDIGGYSLDSLILGEGSPTVVFDAGFSGGRGAWRPLQDSIALHTQTLAYDRAGLRNSELGPEPRTAHQIATELRALLLATDVTGPVILVGHSAGGMFIRSYAAAYPDDVVGMVFVDPATEDIYENMRAQAPDRWDTFIEEVNPSSAGWGAQWEALPESLEQTKLAWPLPQVPMVVLTGLTLLPGEWALETPEYMEFWRASHERLVDQLGGARHIVLEDEDHLTILTAPVLRDAILEIVQELGARGDAF